MKMTSLDVTSLLTIPNVDAHIDKVNLELEAVLGQANPYIRKSLVRLIRSYSKRLRPLLVIAVATSQGGEVDKKAIHACTAVELIHIGSLVHDDIMDNADVRWRVPTINSQEGVNHALVTGDYLFAKAFEQAAMANLEIAALVASALASLTDGESREAADRYNLNRSIRALEVTHQGKTASLFAVCCQIGGLCAGYGRTQLTALADYGRNFGMAFQLLDDVLDLLSTDQLSGKPVGQDASEGIYTLPVLLSLKGNSGNLLRSRMAKTKKFDAKRLVKTLHDDGSIAQTIQKIQWYNAQAAKALDTIDSSSIMTYLKALPAQYLKSALNHYVAREHQSAIAEFLA